MKSADIDAGINICEGRYYLAMFFVNFPKMHNIPRGDIMGHAWRMNETPNHWHLTYRHRYYVTDDPWDGKDTKSWMKGNATGTEEEILNLVRKFSSTLSSAIGLFSASAPPTVDILEIRGDCKKWFEVVSKAHRPWLHLKTIPA